MTLGANAQNPMLEKGFSLKFSFGFPPSQYGFDGDLPIPEGLQLSNTYGLELGNQWYFYTENNIGIGLDINWIEVSYGKANISDFILGDIDMVTIEGSLLEFGPVGTFAINDILALEAYYNLRPSYMATYYYETSFNMWNAEDYVLLRDFSFLHGLGVGVRLKFIYVGFEYTMGNLDGKIDAGGEFEDAVDFGKQKMDAANSKLIVGFQF
jgi:hypothetical protein